MTEQNKYACIVVLLNADNKILVVTRKNDPKSFGLPGGKLDEGETLEQCAMREFKEEVGFELESITPVGVPVKNYIYYVQTYIGYLSNTRQIKTHLNDDGCVVKWVEVSELNTGVFAYFNSAHIIPIVANLIATKK